MATIDRAKNKMENGAKYPPEPQDMFVDWRELNRYVFLNDMYNGTGGVSGRVGTSGKPTGALAKYKNRRDFVYSFITPNPTENFYPTRVRKSVYVNHFRRYITTKYKGVFKIPPATTVTAEGSTDTIDDHVYLDYVRNIDGAGMHKNTFMQNLLAAVYRDGVAFVVTDKDESGIYSYKQNAITVSRYLTDLRGQLTDITFINERPNGTAEKYQWSLSQGLFVFTAPEMVDDDSKKWRLEKHDPAATRYGLPILPVFAEQREEVSDYLPTPPSMGIAGMCVNLYEAGSTLDWLLEKQGHDTMYIVGTVEGVREGLTNMMMLENMDGNASAGILSPDANKATVHQDRIEQKTNDLFEMMLDGGVLVSRNNNAPESGVAKSYTFSPVNDALLDTTKICKAVDAWLQEWFMKLVGGNFVATTHYRDDYSPTTGIDLMTLREVLRMYEERGLTENAKDTLRKIALSINSAEDKNGVTELLEEIDELYTRPDNAGAF